MKEKTKWILSRLSYKNGYEYNITKVPKEYTEEDIRDQLDDGYQNQGWIRNLEHYSFKFEEIKIEPKSKLSPKWKKLCKEKSKLDEEWEILRLKILYAK